MSDSGSTPDWVPRKKNQSPAEESVFYPKVCGSLGGFFANRMYAHNLFPGVHGCPAFRWVVLVSHKSAERVEDTFGTERRIDTPPPLNPFLVCIQREGCARSLILDPCVHYRINLPFG